MHPRPHNVLTPSVLWEWPKSRQRPSQCHDACVPPTGVKEHHNEETCRRALSYEEPKSHSNNQGRPKGAGGAAAPGPKNSGPPADKFYVVVLAHVYAHLRKKLDIGPLIMFLDAIRPIDTFDTRGLGALGSWRFGRRENRRTVCPLCVSCCGTHRSVIRTANIGLCFGYGRNHKAPLLSQKMTEGRGRFRGDLVCGHQVVWYRLTGAFVACNRRYLRSWVGNSSEGPFWTK
jgi:hypothetical protein